MLRMRRVKTVQNAATTKRIGALIGTIIFGKRCMKVAPPPSAASMISGLTEFIPASRTIALNGKLRQTLTNITDASASIGDRKSTRLNSSHSQISYAVFCLKKKKKKKKQHVEDHT